MFMTRPCKHFCAVWLHLAHLLLRFAFSVQRLILNRNGPHGVTVCPWRTLPCSLLVSSGPCSRVASPSLGDDATKRYTSKRYRRYTVATNATQLLPTLAMLTPQAAMAPPAVVEARVMKRGREAEPQDVGEDLLLRAHLRRPAAVLQEEARARTRIRRRAAEDVQTRANARAAAIRMRG